MLIFWHPHSPTGGFTLLIPGGGPGGSGLSTMTPVGTNAALSPRQELSFNHLCDLWRPLRDYASDNKPSAERYELAYVNVRCRFEIKQSTDTTSAIGRLEGDQFFTIDAIHFAERQEIDDNWIVVNRSMSADGNAADTMNGRIWMVRGQPQVFARSERRQGGKKLVMASQEQNPPLGMLS